MTAKKLTRTARPRNAPPAGRGKKTKTEFYQDTLAALDDWDAFLMRESGLPGPRANLELVQVAADLGDEPRFTRWLEFGPDAAPVNSPEMFLPVCGAVGLGKLVAEGKRKHLKTLRRLASDPRWRMREAVAMACQRFGEKDMAALLAEMETWSDGNPLEQRAVVAGLCEPRLLRDAAVTKRVLRLLDKITRAFSRATDRKSDGHVALGKALAYGWSVAVVAAPGTGKRALEKWIKRDEPEVRRMMRENLTKDRLRRMDAEWVERMRGVTGSK